jgi:hypothetical protein
MRKRITAEERKERRMNTLKCLVASQRYPHMKDAGIELNTAIDAMTPKATSGPPRTLVSLKATTYSGMKTLSNPNAIS